ncbi:MAG TPA: hypothetical protein VIA18_22700, partial [Polyangia bacterium]|nr:hypothetical protein [Polyangia bacterium]
MVNPAFDTDSALRPALLLPDEQRPAWPGFVGRIGPDFVIFFALLGVLLVVGHFFGAHYVVKLSTMLLPGLAAPGIIVIR